MEKDYRIVAIMAATRDAMDGPILPGTLWVLDNQRYLILSSHYDDSGALCITAYVDGNSVVIYAEADAWSSQATPIFDD